MRKKLTFVTLIANNGGLTTIILYTSSYVGINRHPLKPTTNWGSFRAPQIALALQEKSFPGAPIYGYDPRNTKSWNITVTSLRA